MSNSRRKFLYFSHSTLQVPRVARQCMVALCAGASELGLDAEIVYIHLRPNRNEPVHPQLRELYEVSVPLKFTPFRLPWLSVDSEGRLVDVLRTFCYGWRMLRLLAEQRRYDSIIVSARNYAVLALLVQLKKMFHLKWAVLADVHSLPHSRLGRWVHRNVDRNVCISASLADALRASLGLPENKTAVAHSGVNIARFKRSRPKRELRMELGLDLGRQLICYTGKVYYRYEEVAYLAEAANALSDSQLMLVVGGRPDNVNLWRQECRKRGVRNIEFRSFVSPADIPKYLQAADLLVMYYSPSALNNHRSPGKLFEYMASGVPLVAADFPSMREVVKQGQNGFLVEPYRPELFAKRISEVLAMPETELEAVARNAVATSEGFSWKRRAELFIEAAAAL